jgi:hypothetical protein
LLGPPEVVAYHLAEAATAQTLDRVVGAAIAAYDASLVSSSVDPRRALRRSIHALELDARPRRDRALLRAFLARASFEAGDRDGTWLNAELAAVEAREAGDVSLFCECVRDMGLSMSNDAPFDRFIALAEDALELADDDASFTPVAMAYASFLAWRGNDVARAEQLSEQAVKGAARLGDQTLLARTLAFRCEVLAGTPRLGERLRLREQYDAANALGDQRPVSDGFTYRTAALLTAGDRDGFDAACDFARRIALERPWWHTENVADELEACRTLLDGDLSGTMALIAPHLGSYAEEGITPYIAIVALLWREGGHTAELAPLIAAIPKAESTSRLVPTLLLLAKAEIGELDEARTLLDEIAVDDFADLFTSYATGVALAMVAEACWYLGDAERAAALSPHLRPYGGQVIVIPPAAGAFGCADHYLGLLAETYGDADTATARLEAALVLAHRIRAPLLAAHTEVALARVLRDTDPTRAEALIASARDTATRLGAARLAANCGS